MIVKIIKCNNNNFWYSNQIGKTYNVRQCHKITDDWSVIGYAGNILKEDCEIIKESNHTEKKINSEYHFTKEVNGEELLLILYIDYEKKTYDFTQDNQEGVMPKDNNECTEINKAYFELGLEVLKFAQSELYE